MIILHASQCERELLLWGETPDARVEEAEVSAKPRRASRKRTAAKTEPAGGVVQPSPYGADGNRLNEVLAELGFAEDAKRPKAESAVAWLPTVSGRPVASSPMIAPPPEKQTGLALAPWKVAVRRLPVRQAVELLCACVGKETLAPGVIVGKDLAYWAAMVRFAGAFAARQKFLPGLIKNNGHCHARWTPILTGPDADALAKLAKAMPAAARALTCQAGGPPETSPQTLASEFVTAVVDHLVRSGVAPGDEWRSTAGTAVAREGVRVGDTNQHEGETNRRAGARAKGKKASAKAPAFDSIHDQWLHALRHGDGAMEGTDRDLARFADEVREWQRPLAVSSFAPFRLVFRLDEPMLIGDNGDRIGAGGGPWSVRYLLQGVDDPSLLVPAEDAWGAKGAKASVLKRNGFKPTEYLLQSLGQACRIDPHIERSLKKAAPAGYETDPTGAHEFLTEKAVALEQAGFGVLLPAWWTRKGTKLRLAVKANVKSPKMQANGGLTLEKVVSFDWQLALGGEPLTYEELQALAKLKAPLVNVRGQWVHMSAEEIQTALDFWKRKGDGKATVREIVQMAIGAAKTPGGLLFEGVAASGWVGDLLAQLDGDESFEQLPPPDSFNGALRPYQVRGYSWLSFLRKWGLGGCLADDMGLGKTIQTLALIQRDWHENGRSPVLLICPTSVVGNWFKEAQRFTPELPVMVHHGVTRAKGASFKKKARDQAIVISSYALLHRDYEVLKQVGWGGVILDEAQNIKNAQTKQAQAARGIPADYRISLTGTPVENNVGDLWSIMEFLNPGFLGTQAEFKRSFFVPIQAYQDPDAAKRLKRVTGPFILRRLKTDKSIISDLPDKLEMKVFCTLTKEQASLYAAVVKEAEQSLDSADGIQRKGMILATLSKLKQVCNHPAQFLGDNSAVAGRSGKLARLTEMLEEVVAVGDRALIFSQFSEMGEILRRYLQETFGREVLFLHGGVTKKQRDRMVERFQADNGPGIFLLSLKAGGTGLNLTRANHVFHFDRWWNPAVENQATDRAFRIGQTKNVQVHKFLCVGTLEEKIDEMIERKKELAKSVVGTGEGWLTELSTAELKELFKLGSEAVAQ